MEIILNETEWAKRHIESVELGDDPYNTFRRLSRYWIDNGYSTKDAQGKAIAFLMASKPDASAVKWQGMIERAVQHAAKQKAVDAGYITITDSEIKTVKKLNSKQLQRLAFTLLCLSKYWNLVSDKNDFWCRTPDTEIMKYANIKTSVRRQSLLYHELIERGLIRMPKKVDNTNVRVCFAEDGSDEMIISDFRNLGYQLISHFGVPCFRCERCGVISKEKSPDVGRKRMYCDSCAVIVKTEQSVNSAMRRKGLSKEK